MREVRAATRLNAEQRRAVATLASGLGGRGAPFVLFGPPGTGKTVTLVECILQVRAGQRGVCSLSFEGVAFPCVLLSATHTRAEAYVLVLGFAFACMLCRVQPGPCAVRCTARAMPAPAARARGGRCFVWSEV